jgi:hypothetical protein
METATHAMSRRDFRERYGDAIADLTEAHWRLAARRTRRPATHDVKATLRAIVDRDDAAGVPSLDPLARALLMDPAWRRFRMQSLGALTRGQLAECAQYALDHFPPSRKPVIERAEVLMTLELLDAAREWHAPRRIKLVRAALTLVFRAGHERATAIIRKAHGELRGRPVATVVAGAGTALTSAS